MKQVFNPSLPIKFIFLIYYHSCIYMSAPIYRKSRSVPWNHCSPETDQISDVSVETNTVFQITENHGGWTQVKDLRGKPDWEYWHRPAKRGCKQGRKFGGQSGARMQWRKVQRKTTGGEEEPPRLSGFWKPAHLKFSFMGKKPQDP